jgi:hypothetical protein
MSLKGTIGKLEIFGAYGEAQLEPDVATNRGALAAALAASSRTIVSDSVLFSPNSRTRSCTTTNNKQNRRGREGF